MSIFEGNIDFNSNIELDAVRKKTAQGILVIKILCQARTVSAGPVMNARIPFFQLPAQMLIQTA